MFKKLLYSLFILIFFLIPGKSFAFNYDTFITITSPVRGLENWNNILQDPLDIPIFLYEESSMSGLPSNWLFRYDAVEDASISAFFKNIIRSDKQVSLGGLLEITPSLTQKAGVRYPNGNTNRNFLSGYSQTDRKILIDEFMGTFKKRFGFYPKSVGAGYIDSYSLEYLQSKYSVTVAMISDDQFQKDAVRVWGGYLGSPYFPDKNNSLVPAQSLQNRVNISIVRWNQKDLFNFISSGGQSGYSVQPNEYLIMGLKTNYFNNLLSQYSQKDFNKFTYLNIGLENTQELKDYRQEIKNIFALLKLNEKNYRLNITSLETFGDWMRSMYPESSPVYFYRSTDPLGKQSGESFWYQSPFYRIGLKTVDGQTKIIDFRVYNREIYEDNFVIQNQNYTVIQDIPALIDTVKFPGTEIILNTDLEKYKTVYSDKDEIWKITLQDGDKKIVFYPDSIKFSGFIVPEINFADLKVTQSNHNTDWKINPQTPFKDTHAFSWIFWITLFSIIVFIIKKYRQQKPLKFSPPIIVGLLCLILISLTVIKSGLVFPFGLGLWGPNGHDAVFHLSLIEKFAQNPFNLNHPQYAGAKLTNYHFVFDYLSGILVRIFGISSVTLFFRFVPILLGLILLHLLNKLMDKWKYSSWEKSVSYVLVFLGGSLGFIPKLITGQDVFSGESAFWVNQSASLFLNPPFALSLVFLLIFLLNIPNEDKIKLRSLLKLIFFGALLSQTKIYAFVLLAAALFFSRKVKILSGVVFLGALFTLPFSSFSGSPFVFDPLWFSRSLFASYDRFYWARLSGAWQSYEAVGNFPKLIAVNIFATVVFLIGNLGVRIIGLVDLFKNNSNDISQKLVKWIIIVGLLLPLLIVQKINPWNTIQFSYYSIFFLGIISGPVILRLIKSIKLAVLRYFVIIFLIFLGTATSVGTLRDYTGFLSASAVGFSEIVGLQTLRDHPKGVVVSPLFIRSNTDASPKPLYNYVSTAYISAFSGQPEFLSDTINLDITGFDYQTRSKQVQRFYNTQDKSWAQRFLKDNDIRYIYETPIQSIKISPSDLSLTIIYNSGGFKIYKTY